MSLKELALEEAVLRTLADRIGDRLKDVRARMQDGLTAAEEEHGTRQISVTLPDGRQVGTISLSGGNTQARITDPDAFKAWVMATYPDEIERRFVTDVRPAFAEKLLAEMTSAGCATVIDNNSGEIHEKVPGVELQTARADTHRLRLKGSKGADGVAAIEAAWNAGDLSIPGLPAPPQLPASATEEQEPRP